MRGNFRFQAFVSGLATGILFLLLHLYTLYIAYPNGLLTTILTLICPIGAELYWIVHIWLLTEKLPIPLTLLCLVWVVLAISTLALFRASEETA